MPATHYGWVKCAIESWVKCAIESLQNITVAMTARFTTDIPVKNINIRYYFILVL